MSFFTQSIERQVNIILDFGDPKLLQVMIGPEFCQIWDDWFSHCLFAAKVVLPVQTLNNQLPLDVYQRQEEVLRSAFPSFYRELPTISDVSSEPNKANALKDWHQKIKSYQITKQQAEKVNESLKKVEDDAFEMYRNSSAGKRLGNQGKADDKLSTFKEKVSNMLEIYKSNAAVKQVSDLDMSTVYANLFKESQSQIKNNAFRVKEGQSVFSLFNEKVFEKKSKQHSSDYKRMSSILSTNCYIMEDIKNNQFVQEVFDKLIDRVLDDALKKNAHPLHADVGKNGSNAEHIRDMIKSIWRKINKSEMLKKYIECYAQKLNDMSSNKENIFLDLLYVLTANRAPLGQHVDDENGRVVDFRQILRSKVKLEKIGSKFETFLDSSIFTITKKAHKLLFDFPFIKDGLDIFSVVSALPSQNGSYSENGKNMIVVHGAGNKGEKEFMDLIKRCIDKTENLSFFDRIAEFFTYPYTEAEKEEALAKLYQAVDIGHLALRTGSDQVILDYILDIRHEMDVNKNRYLRKLYKNFYTILYENIDLPKKMFFVKWFSLLLNGCQRVVEWRSDWNDILNKPGKFEVDNWSVREAEDMKKIETDNQTRERQRLEDEYQRLELEYRRQMNEKEVAEKKMILSSTLGKSFTKKMRPIEETLFLIICNFQSKIISVVVDYSVKNEIKNPEEVLDYIIQKILAHQKDIIQSKVISDSFLENACGFSSIS